MSVIKDEKATTVALVNKTPIKVIDQNNQTLVPIKPICDALGVDFSAQLKKLKEDDFYNSVVVLSTTTGADGKSYQMASLPLKYALLWLGSINPKNVAPNARESVMQYKEACASALYDYFYGYINFVRERNAKLLDLRTKKAEAKHRFATAKDEIKEIDQVEMDIITTTYEDYLKNNSQIAIDFEAVEEGGAQ